MKGQYTNTPNRYLIPGVRRSMIEVEWTIDRFTEYDDTILPLTPISVVSAPSDFQLDLILH